MIRFLLLGLVFLAPANAEETPEAWIEKLGAIYAKHSGFVATYYSEGEGKSLEATLALHEPSGIALIGANVTKDGENMLLRQWLTEDDEVFVDANGQRLKGSGLLTELKSLVTLLKDSLTVPLENFHGLSSSHFTPQLLLTRDSVEQGLIVTPLDRPTWFETVAGASVSEVTETALTFETPNHGLLTISREHGLLLSQSLTGEDGDERLLTLTQLELNPTADRIKDISSDWSTLGATPISVGTFTAEARHNTFQAIIEAVERGDADLEKLKTLLPERPDLLRRLAASSISENSPIAKVDWKTFLSQIRGAIRAKWLESLPEAEAGDERAFEAYLGKPEVREQIRATLMAGFIKAMMSADDPDAAAKIMPDFFGPDPNHVLKADGAAGKTAKSMIETAVALACFEAHIDRKLASAWGEREGLD